jgi:uncharacterized protein (TIGR03086 family)
MDDTVNRKLGYFIEAVETFDAVCRQVHTLAWDNNSPCEGWTARDVLAHQCGVLDALAQVARGEMTRPVMPEPPADPLARWETTRREVLAALHQPGVVEREGKYWFGEMDMASFVSYVQWDPLTHAWDIGVATGIPPGLPPHLCRISYELVEGMAHRARRWGLIGDPVEVPDDASIVDRYLGLVGRRPRAI